MTDIVLNNITSGYNINKINSNFDKIEDSINNDVLNLAGGNNTLLQDIDMNSYDLLNVNNIDTVSLSIDGSPVVLTNLGTLNPNTVGTSQLIDGSVTQVKLDPIYEAGLVKVADLASTVTGKGASLIGFLQAGTGAIARTVQDELRDRVSAKQFGAKFDGVTDDTAAIQRGLTYLASIGGGKLMLPTGKAIISDTLTIDVTGVSMYGMGRGGSHNAGTLNVAPTQLQWAGPPGGTMISIAPSGVQGLDSCDVADIQLLGTGTNRAAYGLLVSSCRESLHRISGAGFSTAILAYTITSGLSEGSDCQGNDIWVYGIQTNVGDGSILLIDAPTVASGPQGNFSFNRVWESKGSHLNGHATWVKGADNNDFYNVSAFRVTGGTGHGLRLEQCANGPCRANVFWHVSAYIYSAGTEAGIYPSIYNNILFLDNDNGYDFSTIIQGTGSILYVTGNHAAIGMRTSSAFNVNSNKQVYADGRTRYSAKAAAIASATSRTITFPTAFATGPIRASCTPQYAALGSAIPYSINVTNTSITIYNNAGAAIDFWWEVEGY